MLIEQFLRHWDEFKILGGCIASVLAKRAGTGWDGSAGKQPQALISHATFPHKLMWY